MLSHAPRKHSASHTITLLVKHAASQPAGSAHHALLDRVLMPALRRGLRLPIERDALRQDLLRLLGATLLIMPSLQPELATLLSPHEPEADFFNNITHVQMPRRQRALARLRQRVANVLHGRGDFTGVGSGPSQADGLTTSGIALRAATSTSFGSWASFSPSALATT